MPAERFNVLIVVLVLGMVVTAPVFTGVAVASGTTDRAGDLEVSMSVPSEATAGESTTIDASASVPDVVGSVETELTFRLLVDGSTVSEQTVTVADGETTEGTFTHTFSTAGTHDVRVEAATTLGGQEFSAGVTKELTVESQSTMPDLGSLELSASVPGTVTVDEESSISSAVSLPEVSGADVSGEVTLRLLADGESVATKTVTLRDGESQSVEFAHAFSTSGETTVTVEATGTIAEQSVSASTSHVITIEADTQTVDTTGVVFKTPASLEDEVATYREELGLGENVKAFVLAKQDSLELVFTTTTPKKGLATVAGRSTQRTISYDDFTFDVVVASSVSYDQTGTETTVQAVRDAPDDYRLDLVRVSTEYRRISVLTDPDQGDDVTASTTAGALVANPTGAGAMYEDATKRARTLARHPNATTVKSVLQNPEAPYLPTFTFESAYWASAPATVDGVVLNPSSRAYEFATTLDTNGLLSYADERDVPSVYVVDSQFDTTTYDTVQELTSNAEELDGEEVTVTARLYRTRVSVQETAEHATTTECSEDLLTVQTPSGPTCVNVGADVLADGGAVWTTVPESRDDVLPVLGLSAAHQDEPLSQDSGRFEITGELVSTSRINASLPDGSILVIHDIERVGDIDYQAVASEVRTRIENRANRLQTYNQRSSGKSISQTTTDPSSEAGTTTTSQPTTTDSTSQSSASQPTTTSSASPVASSSTDEPGDPPNTTSSASPVASNSTDEPGDPPDTEQNSPMPGFTIPATLLALFVLGLRRR